MSISSVLPTGVKNFPVAVFDTNSHHVRLVTVVVFVDCSSLSHYLVFFVETPVYGPWEQLLLARRLIQVVSPLVYVLLAELDAS